MKIISKKGRVFLLEHDLILIAEKFCNELHQSAEHENNWPCIYWREPMPFDRGDGNFAAQYPDALNTADSLVVNGHEIYLDMSEKLLDELTGTILFWNQGIKSRKRTAA